MKVSFIGCPCSGKTTLAAKLFTSLKVGGYPCELLLEQARLHIAHMRYQRALKPGQPLEVSDEDQHEMIQRQLTWEEVLVDSVGTGSVVVTDSSPLNGLLYVSDLSHWYVRSMTAKAVAAADLVFYCPPTGAEAGADPNRLHDAKQQLALDAKIMPLLAEFAPSVLEEMIPLEGSFLDRFKTLHSTVIGALPW